MKETWVRRIGGDIVMGLVAAVIALFGGAMVTAVSVDNRQAYALTVLIVCAVELFYIVRYLIELRTWHRRQVAR